MELDNPEALAFLTELYALTQGDLEGQVSIYEIGDRLGLEKNQVDNLAQTLYIQGVAEMKTLSGGMGITPAGIQALGKEGESGKNDLYVLKNEPVMTRDDQKAVESVLGHVKELVPDLTLSHERMNELIIDLKTADVQLLSERPKTAVLKEILKSIVQNLDAKAAAQTASKIEMMIGSR